MNTARKIILKFGGQSTLARMLGKGQSTVGHWARTGIIPAQWHPVLLKLAEDNGIELSPNDFMENVSIDNISSDDVIVDDESINLPEAKFKGYLNLSGVEIPCYVLSDGQRVIGRTAAAEMLSGIKGKVNLDDYIESAPLRNYLDIDYIFDRMVAFRLPEVEQLNRNVKGLPADLLIELCRAYMSALESFSRDGTPTMTQKQIQVAIRAGMFVAACAKVGLDAMIDEATGYQYERAEDALAVKLRAYLEEEMRPWEKTFPDELWREFGRLTNWKGTVTQRPKYWGKLVMELIYEYLDKDVADWLKNNAPKPRSGQNYHQWLSSQYGLKKLIEHIWMLIGMASACTTMNELKRRMAEKYGRVPVQYTLYLPFDRI